MCAINGITKKDSELVKKMNIATRHRGPDGTGLYSDGYVTLGHNRLAIIDLSDEAAQPMESTDARYVLSFNGEIYNYRELRRELQGQYTFNTQSDTEVLLAAYSIWKEDMLQKLRGIFAFAIWDKKEKELLLVRDHMGVKPLYYSFLDGVLSFSSELCGVLEAIPNRQLSHYGLSFYLSMQYVPGPSTLVENIHKLRAGQLLRFKDGKIKVTSYLHTVPHEKVESGDHVYDTIDAAVKRQLVSDRPVGAFLSGGFDSSIVVHHMRKHTDQVKTYSVDFEMVEGGESESNKFNADARLAEKTSAFFGTNHKTFTITLKDIRDSIESVTQDIDEPVANSTAITQYLLSKFVRNDGTVVVLGGDGGDELFGGYTRHRHATGAYLFQQMPQMFQRGVTLLHPRLGRLSTPFGTPFHKAVLVNDEKNISPFLRKSLHADRHITKYFDELYVQKNAKGRHPVDTFMEVDRETWLSDECFNRLDHTSMAHALELRVPLSDIDVVALADKISIWKKTMPYEGKRIIRKVYRDYLPAYLYEQPKRGWLSPAAKWFRDPAINQFAKQVYSSGYYSGLDSVFDWEQVHKILDDHVEKRGYHLYPLWNILILQIWARKHGVKA